MDDYILDVHNAQALSFARDRIDIYSNSWEPSGSGDTIGKPGNLTRIALREGVAKVGGFTEF